MRSTALALAALAVAAGPLAGISSADPAAGCATEFLKDGHPGPNVVWIDGYGRVVVDPNGANPTVQSLLDGSYRFLSCLV